MITISAEGTGIERLAFEPLAGVMSIPRQARPLEEVLQAIGEFARWGCHVAVTLSGNKDFDDRAGTFL